MKQRASNDIICALLRPLAHTVYEPTSSAGCTFMPKENPNTERYITIARACLKAINDTAENAGSREEKIQAVYQAIDSAFQAEFAEYRQSVAIMAGVLERIASGQLDAETAADLAKKVLAQHPSDSHDGITH